MRKKAESLSILLSVVGNKVKYYFIALKNSADYLFKRNRKAANFIVLSQLRMDLNILGLEKLFRVVAIKLLNAGNQTAYLQVRVEFNILVLGKL